MKGREAEGPVQINRYENDYQYGNERGRDEVPTHYEGDSDEQDQYYFKKSDTKVKAADTKVTGSVAIRINR